MFPLFSFIVLFLSYVTAVCFLSRFPTLLRQFSLTLTLFLTTSFAFLSLFLFLTSVLSFRCLSQYFFLLRFCCLIVYRSSTVFRQFSSTLFALSVVLCPSRVRCFRSLLF